MSNAPESASDIRLLSSEVIDQIAAGEVVERPAHLVKELVENAIDAGASSIEVEYDQGGRRVRVTDDGRGIVREQLRLALARHATSKIDRPEDLFKLATFGFRGEALASIAAVSRFSMQSRPAASATAHRVVSEFGKLGEAEPVGGNPGTTVLVEELFSNIPARLKFLKSEAGENAQIKSTLRALALANEGVEFRIRSKGKLEQVWSRQASFLARAQQVLEMDRMYGGGFEYNGFEAEVAFASPHDVAGNSRSIWIFVQGRWVQDRSLQHAVIEAYRGLLMHGEFPIAAVRLKTPAEDLDVNIHPTKSQVKFRDPQPAFRAVNRALREALERAPWLIQEPQVRAPKGGVVAATEAFAEAHARRLTVAELTRPYQTSGKRLNSAAPSLATAPLHSLGRFEAPEFSTVQFKSKDDHAAAPAYERERGPFTGEAAPVSAAAAMQASAATAAPVSPIMDTFGETVGPATGAVAGSGAWSRLQVLGQAHLTYILAQDGERLVLVDQHAAHERVAYERLMRAWLGGKVDVQPLLLPVGVDLEPDGAEALMSCTTELSRLGVLLDQTGPQSVAICAMPSLLKEKALVKALQTLAREIVERGGSFALERKISDLCATMACHSVVRAGQALSLEQMRGLLAQMDEFPLSSFCPHGRPVSVDYPFAQLERDFGRIV